jgi:hypothetical protein
MEKAKVFDGKFGGKVVKVKFELEFYLPENEDDEQVESMTINEVKTMIEDEERIELGELVLGFLDSAVVVTE